MVSKPKMYLLILAIISTVVFVAAHFTSLYSTFVMPLEVKLIVAFCSTILFVWEQKTSIVCDKNAKTISIVEKALFQDKFTLKNKILLENIEEVKTEIGYLNRWPLSGIISRLVIKTKDKKFIDVQGSPFCIFSFSKKAKVINAFIKAQNANITVTHAPFILRVIGVCILINYLRLCVVIIVLQSLK